MARRSSIFMNITVLDICNLENSSESSSRVRCHVTCIPVQNLSTFVFPAPTLPIHYATLNRLR